MRNYVKMALAIGGVALLAPLAPKANAALVLTLTADGVPTVINDGGAGDADGAVNGRITAVNPVPGFNTSIVAGASNSPGTTFGSLQLSSISVSNTGSTANTLDILLSDTGFSAPGSAGSTVVLDSGVGFTYLNAGVGSTVNFQSYADPADSGLPIGISTGPQGTPANGDVVQTFNSENTNTFVRGAGSYSLTQRLTMTLTPGGQVNFSGTSTTLVPEPASLSVLALGAIGLLARRRK